MRDAPPPCYARSDGRGAQRAPLAKPGTTPALEASASRITLVGYETWQWSPRRPPPFRAQPEGRARNLGEAGSAQPRRGEHWTVGATPTVPRVRIPPSLQLPPRYTTK